MRAYQSSCVHITLVYGDKAWEEMPDNEKVAIYYYIFEIGYTIDEKLLIRKRFKPGS